MRLIRCTRCGGTQFHETATEMECHWCRARYFKESPEAARPASVVDLSGDVEALLRKCETDPANRARYASLVLDIDPTNVRALSYLR